MNKTRRGRLGRFLCPIQSIGKSWGILDLAINRNAWLE